MKIVDNVAALQQELAAVATKSVGFVPTMGALHAGHLSLVHYARTQCDVVVVSIFVNPTQFNDKSDLKHYPRTLEADCELLNSAGVDYVFAPSVEEIYPEVDNRQFDLGGVDEPMEGATRPGHFNGVAQVVSRLFDIVRPTRSYFGEKDFQQVAVIKAMMRSLSEELQCEIITVPIVREPSGLAMSSRNELLTTEHRAATPAIYRALNNAANNASTMSTQEVAAAVIAEIEQSDLLRVIYFSAVDALTMQEVQEWSDAESIQGCIAVQAGNIRLIDNIKLK